MNAIVTINPADFDRINNETASVAFMQELLWAEAYRIGLPLGNITISLNTKTPDGGIDATAVWPVGFAGSSSMIVDGYTAYQVKSGKSIELWQEAAIRKELFDKRPATREHLGHMVRDALDRDGHYVLVDFGHDLTSDQRSTAVGHLEKFLRESCGYPLPKVDVWSRNNLASFLIPFPSLTLNLKGIGREFQTHASWAKDGTMSVAFVPGENQCRQIQALQDALRSGTFHVHITGEPGIGKTRLALEATRADDLRPLVIYCNAESLSHSSLLYTLIQEDAEFSVILVVDECDSDRRAYIANKLKAYSPRIRMISIYAEPERTRSTVVLEVEPLGLEEVSRIIEGHQVPGDIARKWASVCGSSPRVAHLVGINLFKNPNDMLCEPDTERVWDRFVEGSDSAGSDTVRQRRTVLMYLALFKRFGYFKPVDNEARCIQLLIQEHDPTITWLKFVEIIQELRTRKLLQGETTLYITPKLLQIKLWVDWWERIGIGCDINQIVGALPPTLVDWFIEMFEYTAGSGAARKTAGDLLASDGPFCTTPEILNSRLGARFFRHLGRVNPKLAILCLQETLGKWDRETLLGFTNGRRQIIYFLQESAQRDELFVPSARLLLRLAETENEQWTNNATGVFTELFTISRHPELAVTAAPPIKRKVVLEEALNSDSIQQRKIAIRACNRALCERDFGAVQDRLQFFEGEPQLWVPATWGELFDAYRYVWKMLMGKIGELTDEENQEIAEVLIQNTRYLGRFSSLVRMLADDLIFVASMPFADKLQLYRVITELLSFNTDLNSEVRATWECVRESLIGSDYASRMQRYVGMHLTDDLSVDYKVREQLQQTKICELARESVSCPELLAKELPWLVSAAAVNGYQFGYALASEDSTFALLAQILDHQKLVKERSSLYFLGGYLRGVFERDSDEWEHTLDRLAQDEQTAYWIPELTHRAGHISHEGLSRLLKAMSDWNLSVEYLHLFTYGNILNTIPESQFNDLIEFLLDHRDPIAVYIALSLHDRYYISADTGAVLPKQNTLRLLTNSALSELPEGIRHGNTRVMYPYYWTSLARAFLALYPESSLEISAFLLRHFDNHRSIFNDDEPRSLLRSIVGRFPESAWKQIAPYLESFSWSLAQWLRGDNFFGEPRTVDLPILSLLPRESVWQWVAEDVEERAWYMATLVPPSFEQDGAQPSWARELLVKYGDRDDVRRNLNANFFTEGWTGNESSHLLRKQQALLRFREQESDSTVCMWLDDLLAEIDQRIEQARIREERLDF